MGTIVRNAVVYLPALIGVATAHLEGQSRPSNLTATAAGPTPPPGQPTTTAPVPLQLNAPTAVTSGKYRVVANGFSVIKETYDDLLSRDGKYDEVYGGFIMLHFNRNSGDLLDRDLRRTKVLGDIAGFPDRIRAGSGNGPNGSGGLRGGDSYPDAAHARFRGPSGAQPNTQTFPFLLWEGTLTDGADAVVLMPTLWERNTDGSSFNSWQQSETTNASQIWWDGAVQLALKQTSLGVIAPPGATTPNTSPTFNDAGIATGFLAPAGQPWIAALLVGSHDRPIGIDSRPGHGLPRRAIVLTREIVENALSGSKVVPAADPLSPWLQAYLEVPVGVVPVLLMDAAPPGQPSASYVLYLQVERI